MPYSVPGIFNALDNWGAGFGMSPSNTPTENASALQATVNAAQASGNPCGAIVLIPSVNQFAAPPYGAYPIGAPEGGVAVITIPASGHPDSPLLICGTGDGTELEMQTKEASSGQTILFEVSDTSNVTFQDFQVAFVKDVGLGYVQSGVAFSLGGGAGHRLFRVDVENCQYPVVINGTAGVTILQCEFNYGMSFDLASASALQITSATQTMIAQCLLSNNLNPSGNSYYGIQIAQSSFTKVRDTQCTGFASGVVVGTGVEGGQAAIGTTFAGVRVSSPGPAVTIQPSVFDVSFVDCHFQTEDGYAGPGPGIEIGQPGVANQYIDTVRFTSCVLTGYYGNPPYGMQIIAGQNIQIYGGKYSGCATAGIAIAGAATEVQIIGASCIGLEYGYVTEHYTNPLYQLYGITISAGQDIQIINVNCSGSGTPTAGGAGIYLAPSDGATISEVKIIGAICTNPVLQEGESSMVLQEYGVYASQVSNLLIEDCTLTGNSVDGVYLVEVSEATIAGCDLYGNNQGLYVGSGCASVFIRDNNVTGYSSLGAAITFASSLAAIEVTDCAGYNDQDTLVFGPAPPPSGVFSGVSLGGYYGPTKFYLTAGVQYVAIDGQPTALASGAFTLAPGHYAQIVPEAGPEGTMLMLGN